MVSVLKTTAGKQILLYRGNTLAADLSATQYLPPRVFKVGLSQATPTISDTNITLPIPIENGTLNDGAAAVWTGSDGGDNTTDNTSIYKEGAGAGDVKAQNLITNVTSASKVWTKTPLTASVTAARFIGYWLYILDATALAKIVTVDLKLITNGDGATLFYILSTPVANLAIGWNWIYSTVLVSALTQGAGGPPSGALNEAIINITTSVLTDDFVAGDVVYDCLRTWQTSDLTKTYVTGYPVIDLTNMEVTTRCYLDVTRANGFNLTGVGQFNTDATPLMTDVAQYDSESKSSTDEFVYIVKSKLV